jgi:phosphatidate cytidylyltransferase
MALLAIYLFFGSAVECAWMLRHRRGGFDPRPGLLGCAGIMLAGVIPLLWPLSGEPYPSDCILGPLGWPLAAAAIALVGAFAWHMPTFVQGTGVLEQSALSGWLATYFGICFSFWIAIRGWGSDSAGLALAVGLIIVTKCTDAGAFFSGRAFGRHKLCPSVSPGKTVEGLLGGLVAGAVVSVLYFVVFIGAIYGDAWVNRSWLGSVLLGCALTLSGLLGDLLESIVKRESEMKDSSHLLPGLGGLWDVTDSLLPAGVVSYLMVAGDLLGHPA